ncbi:DUF4097 family beta strand repeat-containing protein [Streptomyces sp. FH025]|uniref:DUF4097 family beta strand repeat-containing protein n=1 Tax=Streptomyces sp. FH025 TaxID=2815937 RepID=UPI001A9FF02E|nr:hypothetical protein [Streptomyces sp. FH025]MBO1416975.1 hypothetical protein [Streptomyces sp. FH025]
MRAARIWRLTGVVAVVFVLVMGAGQTLSLVARQQRTEETEYPEAVHRLRLETGSAYVRIKTGADGRVLLRKTLDWMVSEPEVRTGVVDGVMDVGVTCRRTPPFYNCGAQIELEVPPGTEVTGEVTSGSVEVDGLTGPVHLEGTSGAIYLRRLSGEVHARTTSGMVQGTELDSERVDVGSGSGAVDLGFAGAPREVSVSTGSGLVTVTVPRGSHYRISGRTGSGSSSIDPALGDASSPNSLVAEVGSGELKIGYALGGDR